MNFKFLAGMFLICPFYIQGMDTETSTSTSTQQKEITIKESTFPSLKKISQTLIVNKILEGNTELLNQIKEKANQDTKDQLAALHNQQIQQVSIPCGLQSFETLTQLSRSLVAFAQKKAGRIQVYACVVPGEVEVSSQPFDRGFIVFLLVETSART